MRGCFTKMAAEEKQDKRRSSPKKNRGINWSDEATESLLELWAEESIQMAFEHSKSSKETRAVYQNLKVQMENRNYTKFTVQDLINKLKKLRQKYKQEKDKSSRSGTGKRKKWKFFEMMDTTLRDRPQVKPPLVIDSSAFATAELPGTVNNENPEIDDEDGHVDDDLDIDHGIDDSYDGFQPLPLTAEQDTEDKTVQGDGEDQKLKDQDDCKIQPKVPTKKRKRSNMEKSLDVFCERFTQISKEETERYLRAEEMRHEREMAFQLKQQQLENERRRSEREHEINVLKLMFSQPHGQYGVNGFYPATPMYQSSVPMHTGMDNISVSDSDGSSFAML